MCFKGQACQQTPRWENRDGICRANEASLGLLGPFCSIWRGRREWGGQQLELGASGEDKAVGSQGQVLIASPRPAIIPARKESLWLSETSRSLLNILS